MGGRAGCACAAGAKTAGDLRGHGDGAVGGGQKRQDGRKLPQGGAPGSGVRRDQAASGGARALKCGTRRAAQARCTQRGAGLGAPKAGRSATATAGA